MDHPLTSAIATVGAAFALAVGQIPQLPIVMACIGAGSLIGQTITARRKRRRPDAELPDYTVRWTWVGVGFGVLFVIVDAIVG